MLPRRGRARRRGRRAYSRSVTTAGRVGTMPAIARCLGGPRVSCRRWPAARANPPQGRLTRGGHNPS
eukprot:2684761-Alexandrium_andersonii.AAC.1